MSYVTQQGYQMLAARPPPAGWAGQWPPPVGSGPWPPGFPGPPPVPTGIAAPQSWSQGQWVFNPAFHSMVPGASSTSNLSQWAAPWASWGVPAANGAANYNPYKRRPKPADPSYWETQLTDNGLGLSNMHIRNDPPPNHDGSTQQSDPATQPQLDPQRTPWVWAPLELSSESDDRVRSSTASRDSREARHSREERLGDTSTASRHRSSSRSRPETRSHDPVPPTRDPYRRRTEEDLRHSGVSAYSLPDRLDASHRRRATDPPLNTNIRGSHSHGSLNHHHSSTTTTNERESAGYASSRHQHHHHQHRTQEPFNDSKVALQPIFPANIIRPAHNRALGHDHQDSDSGRRPQTYPTHGLGTIPETSSLSSVHPSQSQAQRSVQAQPLRPHHSATSQTQMSTASQQTSATSSISNITEANAFTDEPAALLSPIMVVAPRNAPSTSTYAARPLARHRSEPNPNRDRDRRIERAPAAAPLTVPQPARQIPSASISTPNPLPAPPQYSSYSHSHPHPDRRDRPTPESSEPYIPPQAQLGRRVRRGYWNRRGDHLTSDRHFVVYAPHERSNPPDLRAYPAPTEGYRNHRGEFVPYNPAVPELPESIPLRGRPPVRPYDSFVEYVYV